MLEELGNRHTNRLHTLTLSYLHLNGLKDILKCRRPRQFTYIFKETKQFSATYVETFKLLTYTKSYLKKKIKKRFYSKNNIFYTESHLSIIVLIKYEEF